MAILTGTQIEELRDIICEAFGIDELIQLVQFRLDQPLENIVAIKQPKKNIVFNLIEWLEARDLTRKLIEAVLANRPTVERVQQFCDPFLKSAGPGGSPVPGGPPDSKQIRDRVVQLSTVLEENRIWFQHLNAYKTLHDTLHKLQNMQAAIDQAVERFKHQPADTIELQIIANTLEDDLVATATTANQKTESPEEAGEWLHALDQAVHNLRASLAPPDLNSLKRSVETLSALPSPRQAALNKELVKCAKRLRADQLVDRMNIILAGLGQLPAPEADALQGGLMRFRRLCQQLTGLTADHGACQSVEISLAAVIPSNQITHDQVYGWPNVLADLLRIAARRPGDLMADRVKEYARAFDAALEAATAIKQFALLRDSFGRLFSKTDEDLLQVTDELIQQASLLDARLKRFSL
jgi:hypothetical protein